MNFFLFRPAVMALGLLCLLTPLVAQDTLRLSIPEVAISDGDAFVEVPVYVDYPDSLTSFQMAITWPEEHLTFDTLVKGAVVAEDFQFLYNDPFGNQLRVLVYPPFMPEYDPFVPGARVLLCKLIFAVDSKFNGYANVSFDLSFPVRFYDENNMQVPVVLENGGVVFGDDKVRMQFTPPNFNPNNGRVCTKLRSTSVPALTGFRFAFAWDTTQFRFAEVVLADNPLALTAGEIRYTPTSLEFVRERGAPPSSMISFGEDLVELCFTTRLPAASSQLSLLTDPAPVFLLPGPDTTLTADYQLAVINLFSAQLATTDTVRLLLNPLPVADGDQNTCVELTAAQLPWVASGTFTLDWPRGIILDRVTYPAGSDVSLSITEQTDTSTQFSLAANDSPNVTLPDSTVLAKFCFKSPNVDCQPLPMRLRGETFSRFIADTVGSVPLPFRNEGTNVYLADPDTLRFAIERAVSHPDSALHTVNVKTINSACLSLLFFTIDFDTTILEFVDFVFSERVTAEFSAVAFRSTPANGQIILQIRTLGSFAGGLNAGDLGKIVFRKIGPGERVDLFAAPLTESRYLRYGPDGVPGAKWFVVRAGSITFRETTKTGTRDGDTGKNNPLRIYPNPTRGEIRITGLERQVPANSWLYDHLGRLLWQATHSDGEELRLPALPAGGYFLRTGQSGKVWVNYLVIR